MPQSCLESHDSIFCHSYIINGVNGEEQVLGLILTEKGLALFIEPAAGNGIYSSTQHSLGTEPKSVIVMHQEEQRQTSANNGT